ncbi:hypothetical protein EQ875_01636 [Photobacterium damselae subsp. damselae]|uniref:hypothetical protein n=1 Tax=Photobacterium damselae TaxID=38293 RepID=UPI00109B937B|nr:hypothetical protein [Photobacterium damselae]TGZ35355.1 hypothetical protein EQ875_01636 [Photobacterium damselae subsp. damselae]
MNKFTDCEMAAMRRELRLNGYNSLLRLIVLHDRGIDNVASARRALGVFCSASGSSIKSWESQGLTGVFVDRAIEFAECYHLPIWRYQLEPTNAVVENWLAFDYRHLDPNKNHAA